MSSSIDSNEKQAQIELLPFALNEESFKQWINDLASVEAVEKLQSIAPMLTTFVQLKMPAKLRFLLLKQISQLLNFVSQQLENTYRKNYFPFPLQNQLIIELSAQAYSDLAKNYASLCEDSDFKQGNTFSQQHKTLIICQGIDAQAKVILYLALLYNKPDKGFWSLCFLFYLFAKQNNMLDSGTDQQNICFIKTFKQILIFELSNTHQFNTEEILGIFQLFTQFSGQVDLLSTAPEKKFKGLPFFDLRADFPPSSPQKDGYEENPFLIYISSLYLIKNLVQLSANKQNSAAYSKSLLLRLIKTLTMNQQRLSERELTKDQLHTLIGLDRVLKFLKAKHKKSLSKTKTHGKIPDLDFGIISADKNPDDMDTENSRSERDANVAIATEFDGIEYIKSEDIWSTNKKKQQFAKKPANTHLLDQSITGFRLSLIDNNVTIKVGDIIGLLFSKNLIICIIRRIISAGKNEIQIGVEKLGSHAKLLPLTNSKTVIYLKDDEGVESVVIKVHDFENDDYLFVQADTHLKKYKIEKQLHASSIIRHLKISYIS